MGEINQKEMKKIIILGITVLLTSLVLGQEDTKKITAESQFNLVRLNGGSYLPNLKFRYFLSEKTALRLGINYTSLKNRIEINEVDGEGVGSVEKTNSLLDFSLGFEKHFREDKVSPYFGAEFSISTGNKNEFGSRTDSVTFIPNYNYSSKVPVFGLGLHFFTGVDVDLYKNLYVGTELGLAYKAIQEKKGVYNVKDASSLTDPDVSTPISAKKTTTFQLVNMGIVRLGWRF